MGNWAVEWRKWKRNVDLVDWLGSIGEIPRAVWRTKRTIPSLCWFVRLVYCFHSIFRHSRVDCPWHDAKRSLFFRLINFRPARAVFSMRSLLCLSLVICWLMLSTKLSSTSSNNYFFSISSHSERNPLLTSSDSDSDLCKGRAVRKMPSDCFEWVLKLNFPNYFPTNFALSTETSSNIRGPCCGYSLW